MNPFEYTFTAAEVDEICAGLGALRKKITDRIKNNEKNIDRPNSPRHLEYNRRRLERIDALYEKIIKEIPCDDEA